MWAKRSAVSKDQVAKLVDDTYRYCSELFYLCLLTHLKMFLEEVHLSNRSVYLLVSSYEHASLVAVSYCDLDLEVLFALLCFLMRLHASDVCF